MMTQVRQKNLHIFHFFLTAFFLQFIFLENIYAQEICTRPLKPTRYVMQTEEDFFSVLKNFRLEPVIGDGGSLEALQKLNNLKDATTASAGTEVVIPIKCEEQLMGWRVVDKGVYRVITSEKIADVDAKDPKKITTEPIGTDNKTTDILNKEIPGEVLPDIDGVAPSEEISEALRYRMICEGEWTGTECITRYSTIYVLGGAGYNRYDGIDRTTGGQGVLLSKLNPEVGMGWNNYWTDHIRTDLYFTVLYNDIHPEIRERPIDQSKKILNTFAASARYETGKWGFTIGMEQRERLFYRFLVQNIVLFDDGGVVVNAVPLVDIYGRMSYMFHQAGKYRFDGEISLVSILGGSTSGYAVRPGTATEFAVNIQHDRVKEYIFGTVKYEMSQQDTDILLQKASELSFRFGYAWKLKDW